MHRRSLLFAASAAASLLSGCTLLLGELSECASDADCDGGLVCREQYCVVGGDGGGGDSLASLGCTKLGLAPEDPDPVKLAILAYLTGSDGTPEANGSVTVHAAQLAFEEMNRFQGTGTHQFEVWACDTRGEADVARKQAKALIAEGIVGIVGPDSSSETLGVAAETVAGGTVVISPSATSPSLTYLADRQAVDDVAGLVWRTSPSDALQGAVAARVLADGGATNVAGFVLDDPYGNGLWEVFAGDFVQAPRTAQRFLYRRGEDVSAAVTQAIAASPDTFYVIAFPDDAVRILDALAGQTALFGSSLFFSDSAKTTDLFLVEDPDVLEGARGTAPASPSGPELSNFREAFVTRFPEEDPTQFAFIEHAYDAAYLLGIGAAWAQGQAGDQPITGPRIAEGLTHLSAPAAPELDPRSDLLQIRSELFAGRDVNIRGASGALDYDAETGEAPSPIEVWRIEAGAFLTAEVLSPP